MKTIQLTKSICCCGKKAGDLKINCPGFDIWWGPVEGPDQNWRWHWMIWRGRGQAGPACGSDSVDNYSWPSIYADSSIPQQNEPEPWDVGEWIPMWYPSIPVICTQNGVNVQLDGIIPSLTMEYSVICVPNGTAWGKTRYTYCPGLHYVDNVWVPGDGQFGQGTCWNIYPSTTEWNPDRHLPIEVVEEGDA